MKNTNQQSAKYPTLPIPETILRLIDRFDQNKDEYTNPNYNETQLRREFLDPFFEALGWDIANKQSFAEAYKDVVHEDAIKVGSATKAPDYSFRIGGTRKFFVEAKKPALNLKEDVSPAFQLRRYAWSAKLPLSILSDFQEFIVFDCRIKPSITDKASTARLLYIPYDSYEKQWSEIYNIFSHEAVLNGSFDKYADTNRLKKGTAEVDDAFLKEIESWRDTLARTIALRNTKLTQRELNFAVQRTIDRIIFLRICEDRGIETYGTLMGLQDGENVYKKLCKLFHRADEKYNSGLFHFQQEKGHTEIPDELTLKLDIDDKPLKEIIRNLYYPDSPYEFSVLPADILGQVYEQFLGKVIRLTSGHRAVIEDKPEVKKAGGIYYTPTYIVEYIVKNTVDKLLEGKTPDEVAKLRILDIAVGSGSFLIVAYQHLLNWHRDWYIQDGVEKWTRGSGATLYQGQGGDWKLTTSERKRILLNNIYGVDIDSQAVEVTKLSLLLKVLEGENEQTLSSQLKLFHERALPDLSNNIKCGNSLIGPDFYDGKHVDDEERLRINAFDWNTEFAEIMKEGGFDAVIGNPPYIFGEYHNQDEKYYFASTFKCAHGQYDTYWLFVERGLNLTRIGGYFSLIVPDALLARDEVTPIRTMLLQNGLDRVFHCGQVFKAAVSTVVFTVQKGTEPTIVLSETRCGTIATWEHDCARKRFLEDTKHRLLIHTSDCEADLLKRINERCIPLIEVVKISRGEEVGKRSLDKIGLVPILVGEDVARYRIQQSSRFTSKIVKDQSFYASPKIIIVKTGRMCVATMETKGLATVQSLYNLHIKSDTIEIEALLGLLNSKFMKFFINSTFTAYKTLFPQMNQSTLESVPIPADFSSSQGVLLLAVQKMLHLNKCLAEANIEQEKTTLQRQIDATDKQIDALVYKLYDLTDEEIKIVEGIK